MDRTVTRRQFFAITAAAGTAGAATALPAHAVPPAGPVAMLIDLTKCDGCPDVPVPRCVAGCREANRARFPEPQHPIPDNWPTGTHEDWSGKRHVIDTLTPYSWTFVQKVVVEHEGRRETVHVPRHCMHCDTPPCANLCPFGAQAKQPEGPVTIDPDLCLGGAKCRTVCPWHIPQRQGGVGVYMAWQPVPAGAGVMYKCDLCVGRIRQGGRPACVDACNRQAISFGQKLAVRARAEERAKEIGGHTYGLRENGGTSVFYVSRVPFEAIDAALRTRKDRFAMPVGVRNPLERASRLAESVLIAPVAAGAGAVLAAVGTAWKLGRRAGAAPPGPPPGDTQPAAAGPAAGERSEP